jgi:hypothetical protein
MAVSCKYGDEPVGSGATELVTEKTLLHKQQINKMIDVVFLQSQ